MRPFSSRPKLRRLTFAAATSALVAAISLATYSRDPTPEAHAAPSPAPEVPVAVVVVREVTDMSEFTGHLAAAKTVEVRARVPGFVQSVHFAEGSVVKAGDLLFRLDARSFAATRDRFRGELDETLARLDLATTDLARSRELFAHGAVPTQELDARRASERSLEARARAARAALAAASLDLSFARVTAPIAGRIGRALLTEGNVVAGGAASAPLATIVSIDPIHVLFDVDEATYLAAIRAMRGSALTASVRLESDEGFPREAKIDFVDNRLDSTTGTVRVRAILPNSDASLSPGLFARVRLPVGTAAPTVLVDDAAIGTDQGKRYVLVVGSDGLAQYRPVTPGAMVDGLRVIQQGLEPGESIVVRGLVRPGTKISPRPVTMAQNVNGAQGG